MRSQIWAPMPSNFHRLMGFSCFGLSSAGLRALLTSKLFTVDFGFGPYHYSNLWGPDTSAHRQVEMVDGPVWPGTGPPKPVNRHGSLSNRLTTVHIELSDNYKLSTRNKPVELESTWYIFLLK